MRSPSLCRVNLPFKGHEELRCKTCRRYHMSELDRTFINLRISLWRSNLKLTPQIQAVLNICNQMSLGTYISKRKPAKKEKVFCKRS